MSRAMVGPGVGESAPIQFDRAVVLANPVSTNVDWAFTYLRGLEDSPYTGDRRVNISTEPNAADTQDKLAEVVREGDVVIVAGGDKTVGDAAGVVLGSDVPLLPIWAGNASDIAHMLNGSRKRLGLAQLLETGSVVSLYPIQQQTSLPDGTKFAQTAVNYSGFGLSGLISHRVNLPEHRGHPSFHRAGFRRRHENMIGIRSALDRPTFVVEWGDETPDRFSTISSMAVDDMLDLTVATGHRMGKRSNVLPVQLADEQLFVGRIEADPLQAVVGIGRMALRRTTGQHLEPGEVLNFQLLSETWAHTDGDARHLPVLTTERIWQSRLPYLAISTLIAPA